MKEGLEKGQKTEQFVSQLRQETLGLKDKPLIDRAHRAVRQRQEDNLPPRHLILRVHYCHDLEEILQKVRTARNLSFQGQRLHIFRDLPPAVAKKRAAFTPARSLLRDKPGVKFGLQYPAKLRVTYQGKESLFTDAEKALQFAEHHFGKGHD